MNTEIKQLFNKELERLLENVRWKALSIRSALEDLNIGEAKFSLTELNEQISLFHEFLERSKND